MASRLSKAEKIKQMKTGYVLGNDRNDWTTAATRANTKAGSAIYQKQPYISKNESRVILGDYLPRGGVDEHFTSVAKVTSSVYHPAYMKSKPKEGFDRLTANRTNYDLGGEAMVYETQAMRGGRHPRQQPTVKQPDYHVVGVDLGMRTFEGGRRCNGLERSNRADYGVAYNIVNGRGDPEARGRQRVGPRLSNNRQENSMWQEHRDVRKPQIYNTIQHKTVTQVGKPTMF